MKRFIFQETLRVLAQSWHAKISREGKTVFLRTEK